jgi:TatD DNase family protein
MEERPEPRGVMHCFPGDWSYAKVILDMGLYISFTGLITFSKNYGTFEVIKNTPLDRLMIETDCPFMSPEPYRGKRNEPVYVIEVAKKIAEIKKLPLEKVAEQTSENAVELFKLKLE